MKELFVVLIFIACSIAGSFINGRSEAGENKVHGNRFDHIFVIMMENESYETLIGNRNAPWINQAAGLYGIATQYYGVAHPSQPNYIAATSGSTHGVHDDELRTLDVRNLADQLEEAGKNWKDYQQALSFCRRKKLTEECRDPLLDSSLFRKAEPFYVRKHNPFVSYLDIQKNPARMEKVVDLTELETDLDSGELPDFAWITPDMCHDMHGRHGRGPKDLCDFDNGAQLISAGDRFLKEWVEKIMASRAWTTGRNIIFITWDESDDLSRSYEKGCCGAEPGGGHIILLVISSPDPGPRKSDRPYNHYSLLGTIEDALNLGCLANTCKPNVARITDLVSLP